MRRKKEKYLFNYVNSEKKNIVYAIFHASVSGHKAKVSILIFLLHSPFHIPLPSAFTWHDPNLHYCRT
jgi:hypothetical protein